MAGITANGFNRLRLADIQTEIQASITSVFGSGANFAAGSVWSQLTGIFAEREDLLWQGMEDVYNSQSPDTAFGASLDNVGALRGIPRLSAKASVATNVKLFGVPGTVVPATTTQFSVLNSPTAIFALNTNQTLGAGQSCVQTINFASVPSAGSWSLALGGSITSALAFNATASQVQTAIRALKFASACTVTGNYSGGFVVTFVGAGTGGFMVQPLFVVSTNTLGVAITPVMTQAGIDQASGTATAIATGPKLANAGTLSVINTPVSGLNAVLNTVDASVGMDVEADNVYRARMAQQLQIAGAGTVEAIRSKLLQVTGVTAVIVFENSDNIPDLAGRPPHSFECVVQGGADADIANALWLAKPAGILTDGSTSYVITDSQGMNHTVRFSRPTVLPIYIILNIQVDSNYPAGGDATVIQDLVTYGNSLGIGQSVIVVPKLISSIAAVPGIDSATILIGTSPSPTLSNNIIVASNQITVFDTSRVTVVHV